MANGCWRRACVRYPRIGRSHPHGRLHHCSAGPSHRVGQLPRHHGSGAGRCAVRSTNMDDVPLKACWKPQHSNDVYADPWRVSDRCQPLRQTRSRRMEYVGHIPPDSPDAGLRALLGCLLRGPSEARRRKLLESRHQWVSRLVARRRHATTPVSAKDLLGGLGTRTARSLHRPSGTIC